MHLRYLRFAVLLLLVATIAAVAAEPEDLSSFSWQPRVLVNGSACLFTVAVKGSPQKVTAQWMGHELPFTAGSGGAWYALAGISLDTKPGTYDLMLEAVMRDGRVLHQSRPVAVQAAKYKTSRLTVPQKYVTPEAIEPLFEKKMEAFSALFLIVSFPKIGTSAVQSRATAGVAGSTYIFCLPGSPGACKDAWDEILVHQLDYRHGPCNFVEIMPRLDEHLRREKAKGATV